MPRELTRSGSIPRTKNPWTPPLIAEHGLLGWIAANLAATALYFALGLVVSRFFAAYGLFPAPIWLPAGVAMVAAMIGGGRMLPGIFLGSFLTNDLLFAPALYITTIISATNALGPVAGAVALLRLRPKSGLFTSFPGVIAFLVCTTFLSPAISATGGAVAMAIGKPPDPSLFYSTWVNWWLTDSGGTLYLAPALILWLGMEKESDARLGTVHGGFSRRDLAVWAWIAVVSIVLFLTPPLRGSYIRSAFPFLLVVPLSWIALRMSLRSAYTLVSLVAVAATAGTVAGYGPFQDHALANPLQLVGTLVVLLAMNVLTIVALVSERQEAENANKVKAMFLAKTSHELRTPLNAIIGFSSILDKQVLRPLPNHEKFADYARLIQSSGEHLLALIEDLLAMSKIEAGHLDLHEERISLSAALEDAATVIGVRAQAKSVAVRAIMPREDLMVEADAKALRQILLNLLSNAVKYTPEGGTVDVEALLGDDGEAILRVSDTGIGIPADALERVFIPFERADRDAIRDIEGTGLGLSITRGLVQLHGGTITLESEVGEGTVVTVILPAHRVVTPARPGTHGRPRATAG
jgi:signal transduction histidine kinase